MKVIVGLGNPGKRYENTKHNIGFTVVDLLAGRHGIEIRKLKHKALIGEGLIAGQKVLFVKPQTFMNLSGRSVFEIVNYYEVSLSDLYVVYDDVDLPVGTLRIRARGSAGTHNGMRNIIYLLADEGFARFRIGIGADRGETPLRSYVLSGFEPGKMDQMRDVVIRCVDAIEASLAEGLDAAMLKYNTGSKKTETDE